MGDLEARFDLRLGPAPDRVFVFNREDPVEAVLVEGIDHSTPVDLTQPGDAVAPPAEFAHFVAEHQALLPHSRHEADKIVDANAGLAAAIELRLQALSLIHI